MAREFGALLRHLRETTDFSMGNLARYLGVAIPYLSGVERGRRAPLSNKRIKKAVAYLGLSSDDHEALLASAAESRGFFELVAHAASPAKQELGAALARGWSDLDEGKVASLRQILAEGNQSDSG